MDTGFYGTGTFATVATDMRETFTTVTMASGTSVTVARDTATLVTGAMDMGIHL